MKTGEIIKRAFLWKIDDRLRKEGVNQFYIEAYLMDEHEGEEFETDYFFVAWGNEARMELRQKSGGSPFIHYHCPEKYARAVLEFVHLCKEHFGNDWLERGG